MPTSDLTDIGARKRPETSETRETPEALARRAGFIARRTAGGIELEFPPLRASGVALGLCSFAVICGLMPALGLSALLPLKSGDASALLALALIGGLAAPFILASVVFAALAVYLTANSLRVAIDAGGVRTERRVFGRVTRRRAIVRDDISDIEPRIGARYQNVFSATPRYALVATPRDAAGVEVVVSEDLLGQALMIEMRTLIRTALCLPPEPESNAQSQNWEDE